MGGGGALVGVILAGVSGRTGREVGRAVVAAPDLRLVGALGHGSVGRDAGEAMGMAPLGVPIAATLPAFPPPEGTVYVDFTRADAARANVPTALAMGLPAVVGTTGFDARDLEAFESAARAAGVGVCVIANFALGAALTARLSALVVDVFPDVEIVELHGSHKRDRPSGTAAALAADLAGRRPGGREVPVHSVRLPGLVAHQEVLFGRPGELITLRHDVFSREAYTQGVLLAIRRVGRLRGLVTRLEEVWEGA